MYAALAVAAAALAVLGGLLAPPILRRRKRARIFAQPLPAGWRAIADRNVPIRASMPAQLRTRHEQLLHAFLTEKDFIGCNGLVVTDEMQVTVAAQACLLLLGRPGSLYDELRSILVYPTAFWVEDEVHDDDGLVTRRRRALSGEAWDSSRVILAWDDIEQSFGQPGDGFNLVLHECAHYLEAEGHGLAPLPHERDRPAPGRERAASRRVRDIDSWTLELADEFNQFQEQVDGGAETFLDPYAAEDETEFFAVATEEFYERPVELRAEHARLYALLAEFYGVDPAAWLTPPA